MSHIRDKVKKKSRLKRDVTLKTSIAAELGALGSFYKNLPKTIMGDKSIGRLRKETTAQAMLEAGNTPGDIMQNVKRYRQKKRRLRAGKDPNK